MIRSLSISEMEKILSKEQHFVRNEDLRQRAGELLDSLDSRFDEILSVYSKTGKYTDYSENNISVLSICALRNCGFLEAVILMNEYIKNPEKGLAMIVRR